MSYRITYGPEQDSISKRKFQLHLPVAAVLAVLLAVAIRFTYPEETKQLAETLFPLTSAASQEALEAFSENIRAGESFGDAVTAFCLEIINEADIS